MDILSLCPFSVGALLWEAMPSQWSLTVCVKATFSLVNGGESVIAPEQDPIFDDRPWEKTPESSLFSADDLSPLKSRVDVLFAGHAYAPGGEPMTSLRASLRVGELYKSLRITGDRPWVSRDGRLEPGEPAPFVKMPIRYERAAASLDNPAGMGGDPPALGALALPNIEAEEGSVAGFCPMAPLWPARRDLIGDGALRWAVGVTSSARVPIGAAPPGFDFRFFNAAPFDQQIDMLRAGVVIELENLHPAHPRLETKLPAIRPQVFRVDAATGRVVEVALRCDTLLIEGDRGVATLTWRGLTDLRTGSYDAIGRLVVASDPKGKRITADRIDKVLREDAKLDAATEEDARQNPLEMRHDAVLPRTGIDPMRKLALPTPTSPTGRFVLGAIADIVGGPIPTVSSYSAPEDTVALKLAEPTPVAPGPAAGVPFAPKADAAPASSPKPGAGASNAPKPVPAAPAAPAAPKFGIPIPTAPKFGAPIPAAPKAAPDPSSASVTSPPPVASPVPAMSTSPVPSPVTSSAPVAVTPPIASPATPPVLGAPSAPSVLATPSAPDAPSAPSAPTTPSVLGAPPAPSGPSAPSAPKPAFAAPAAPKPVTSKTGPAKPLSTPPPASKPSPAAPSSAANAPIAPSPAAPKAAITAPSAPKPVATPPLETKPPAAASAPAEATPPAARRETMPSGLTLGEMKLAAMKIPVAPAEPLPADSVGEATRAIAPDEPVVSNTLPFRKDEVAARVKAAEAAQKAPSEASAAPPAVESVGDGTIRAPLTAYMKPAMPFEGTARPASPAPPAMVPTPPSKDIDHAPTATLTGPRPSASSALPFRPRESQPEIPPAPAMVPPPAIATDVTDVADVAPPAPAMVPPPAIVTPDTPVKAATPRPGVQIAKVSRTGPGDAGPRGAANEMLEKIGVDDYARIVVAIERGEVGRVLAEMKLQLSDLMRIQLDWSKKIAGDPALNAQAKQAIQAARKKRPG